MRRDIELAIGAGTWSILRQGFSVKFDSHEANRDARECLGFKYSYRVIEFRV